MMLFYFVIAWTFLSMQKSLGGNIVVPITLEHYYKLQELLHAWYGVWPCMCQRHGL